MDIQWRTIQLFLEEYGVVEVELDQDNNQKVRCTCPSFSKAARCKHTRYVKDSMDKNEGHYAIQIKADVDEDDAVQAMKNANSFRDFVVKYAKVEVID
ncbi:hypothetical protein UFOVP111_62 [uncultured Caudovirales phage]|uniref:SWIM-type domain-containing protein n=1 Tax=uncultured Caudovirales phage TaxID=2100421 RepID=A0A6J5L1L9_9CAUD|nr:hypothetical protein UFOVP111_62 [uncultured Caudovirales phage]